MDSFFKKENRFPCPPDTSNIKKNMNTYLKKGHVYAEEDEIKDTENMISCVEYYLNLYNMFVTGNPPKNTLIQEIYNKTKNMINSAIDSRKFQKEQVKNKLKYYKKEFKEECNNKEEGSYCEDLWYGICVGDDLLESFDYDFKTLNEIKSYCESAASSTEMSLCVEKFVSAAHERGPYIPLGCNGYLTEVLSEEIEGGQPEHLMARMTSEIEDETQRVLNCLKDYKP